MRKRRTWRLWQKGLMVVVGGLVLGLLGGFLFGLAIGDTRAQLGFDTLFVGLLLSPLIMLGLGLILVVCSLVARWKVHRSKASTT